MYVYYILSDAITTHLFFVWTNERTEPHGLFRVLFFNLTNYFESSQLHFAVPTKQCAMLLIVGIFLTSLQGKVWATPCHLEERFMKVEGIELVAENLVLVLIP